jgi:hypothetical protein
VCGILDGWQGIPHFIQLLTEVKQGVLVAKQLDTVNGPVDSDRKLKPITNAPNWS